MFRISFLFLSLIFSLDAATFHALLVSDNLASMIGKSSETSSLQMEQFVRQASRECGMPLKLSRLTGDDLTLETFIAWINLLEIEEDDTVMFCFWGHGSHCGRGDDPWPCLYFTKESDDLALSAVVELLRSFSPRLLIALADCCNTFLPPPLQARSEVLTYEKNRERQFTKLCREPRGEIIIASSEIGRNAFSNGSQGHLFTNGLIRSMMFQTKKREAATWESVLKMAEGQVIRWQKPYWEISLY